MLSSGLQGPRIFQQMEKNVYGLTKQRALITKWIVHMQVKTILIVWKVAEDFLHGKTNATISRPWKFARQIGCTWREVQCKRGQKVWPTPGTRRCLITASLQRPRMPGTASKMPCLLTTNVWPGARIGVTKDPPAGGKKQRGTSPPEPR